MHTSLGSRRSRRFLSLLACLPLLVSARAQNGALDQVSPVAGNVNFPINIPETMWQAQVRAGIAGRLEGVTITSAPGAVGQTLDVRLRIGPAWNTTPVVFAATATKQIAEREEIFVDMSSAAVTFNVNDLFVIEFQGTGAGFVLKGNHANPPLYPEQLMAEPGYCLGDCLVRIAFQTWIQGEFTESCFGDGTQALPCPCGNSGMPLRGCENSEATGGARLVLTGATTPDSVGMHASGLLSTSLTIFLQGDAAIAPNLFGDGLLCTGGLLTRLYTESASGGFANAPLAGDPSVSAQSALLGDPIQPGQSRWYQAYYRDPDASFCPAPAGNTFNISNAVRVDW